MSRRTRRPCICALEIMAGRSCRQGNYSQHDRFHQPTPRRPCVAGIDAAKPGRIGRDQGYQAGGRHRVGSDRCEVDDRGDARTILPKAMERIEKVLGPGRLKYVHPDCGFWMHKRSVADAKMVRHGEGAGFVFVGWGGGCGGVKGGRISERNEPCRTAAHEVAVQKLRG